MGQKITLPESGLEVQLAALDWEDSKGHAARAYAALKEGKSDEFMEEFLRKHYAPAVLDVAMKKRPDAVALYNDTVRYNFREADAVKNSLRSGTGEPTQTD
jgi:hypothetical protein